MKISRKGTVKLGRNDLRLGNFIYTREKGYIKVRDLDGMICHSFRENIAKGQMFSMLIDSARGGDGKSKALLEAYCAVLMNVLCCVPFTKDDGERTYLEKLNDATVECFNKNRGLYGVSDEVSDEEDAKVLEEQKEIKEFIDEYNV